MRNTIIFCLIRGDPYNLRYPCFKKLVLLHPKGKSYIPL